MKPSEIHDLQERARCAEQHAVNAFESEADRLWRQPAPLGKSPTEWISEQPVVQAAQQNARVLRNQVAEAQRQIGGIVFCVAEDNFYELEKRLKALNKRAAKTGVPETTMTPTDERVTLNYRVSDEDHRTYDFVHRYVIISGTAPQIPGFTIIAKLSHTDQGVIIGRVPLPWLMHGQDEALYSEIDLSKYFDAKPVCQHCNKIRSRNETFIVHNDETGEVKQIGRTCLRDYTGVDTPERIAKHLEYVEEFFRSARASRGQSPAVTTLDYMTHVCAMIRGRGYRKGDTKFDAISNYWKQFRQERFKGAPQWEEPIAADRLAAENVIAWGANITQGENDFLHNLKTALCGEFAEQPMLGFLAYAPVAYNKAVNTVTTAKGDGHSKKEVDHIGIVKQRLTREFTVEKIRQIRNEYVSDYVPLYILRDTYGNPAKWFASRDYDLMEGGTYLLTGTVKEHETHERFGKSTRLTRCKVEATIKEPVAV